MMTVKSRPSRRQARYVQEEKTTLPINYVFAFNTNARFCLQTCNTVLQHNTQIVLYDLKSNYLDSIVDKRMDVDNLAGNELEFEKYLVSVEQVRYYLVFTWVHGR